MTVQTESTEFNVDSYIPMGKWGKDHWSLLGYMHTVLLDCGGFQVGLDARMRQGRRNFRVMDEQCPVPKRPTRTSGAMVMDPKYGTRLNDGTYVPRHDDWHCVQDMAHEGLLLAKNSNGRWNLATVEDIEPGVDLRLSDAGYEVLFGLIRHKHQGGNYAAYVHNSMISAEAA